MKDKEMVEEMARDLCNRYNEVTERCRIDHYGCNYTCGYYDNAKTLFEKGYRKIPENAVVLSREDYNRIRSKERLVINLESIKKAEDKTRKETAREILKEFYKEFVAYACVGDYYTDTEIVNKIQDLAKKYGVEVEE